MQCATLIWLVGRPSCLECVRAEICTESRSVSSLERIQNVAKIGCGQVNAHRRQLYTRIRNSPLASPKHPKLSTTIEAAARQERRKSDVAKAVELTIVSSELHVQYGAWCHGVS
jgi:hypothetical protein